jgi:tetratricopeptide (TPR) repeat protein
MASAGDPGNIDDIIKKAEAERFVGREREIESFRRYINLTPPTYVIFSITGQGGVGKTALLNRYQEIARNEFAFLLAGCDEQQRDIPTVLGHFAQQLSAQNAPLKHFNERYKIYRQKMNEIENDPAAPQGLAALLGRTAVHVAFGVGDLVPGVRKGLELLPQDSLATQASEWTSYLAKKLTNKDDVALVRDPVPVLTPLFFTDLNVIAQKQKVLLCFENFEATLQELQQWLIHLGDYKASQHIRFVIAGRYEPGVQWGALSHITRTIRLDVLTEPEAEKFLNVYGVTNPTRRAEILEKSGRLPVIMSWLAAPEGNEPDISVPTHSIVERFLRWVDDPQLRQVALVGAIPLTFNMDILKLLLNHQGQPINEQRAFEWLLTMPFVKQRSDGWYYHEVVRRRMMYYQHQRSPQSYRQKHTILADFYNQSRQELSLSEQESWTNRQWRKDTLAYCTHYLLAHPTRHWAEVITIFALAVRKRRTFSIELIEMLSLDDVQNELSDEQTRVVQLFRQQLQAIGEGNLQDGFAMFDELCQMKDLSSEARGHMLAYRGECHRLKGNWEEALNDFNEALRYLPEDVRTLARRGTTFILLQRFEKALTDLNRAIALDAKNAWANAVRGEAHRRLGRYDEALADLNRAIELDEKHSWALAMRGETYRQMGRHQEALNDFDRAIALDEKYSWAIARREETERQMKHTQEEQELASRNSRDVPDPTMLVAPSWATPLPEDSASAPPLASNIWYDNPREPPIPYASTPQPMYSKQPNIPTWQDPSQQAIPYVAASPPSSQGSQQDYGQPPIPYVARSAPTAPLTGSPTPLPMFTLPNTPPIPPIAPKAPPIRFRSPIVIGLLIALALIGLVILGFLFHIL